MACVGQLIRVKIGMVVGALRVACYGLCTAVRFHIAEENAGCLPGWYEGLDCPTLFYSHVLSGLALAKAFHLLICSMIVQNCRPKRHAFAISLPVYLMLSSRHTICGEQIGVPVLISKNSCVTEFNMMTALVRRGRTPTRRCAWGFTLDSSDLKLSRC